MKPRYKPMRCADCGLKERLFVKSDGEDWSCTHCGWLQRSSAAGAAELCREAVWHYLIDYMHYAQVAHQGGIEVPAFPPHYAPYIPAI